VARQKIHHVHWEFGLQLLQGSHGRVSAEMRKLEGDNEFRAELGVLAEPIDQKVLEVQEHGLSLPDHGWIQGWEISMLDEVAEVQEEIQVPASRRLGVVSQSKLGQLPGSQVAGSTLDCEDCSLGGFLRVVDPELLEAGLEEAIPSDDHQHHEGLGSCPPTSRGSRSMP